MSEEIRYGKRATTGSKVFKCGSRIGRKILETKAAEYRARAQKIVSCHVVKKKSNQPTFRLERWTTGFNCGKDVGEKFRYVI